MLTSSYFGKKYCILYIISFKARKSLALFATIKVYHLSSNETFSSLFSFFFSTYALSFYKSQNVLCLSKLFEQAQKFECIKCLFKNYCASTETNFTERKSSFCQAQIFCDCHNIQIDFWSGTKKLDQPKTFWDL